ncbi:hypothetical protein PHLGIDRAFT_130425 [Phlebiopsis gigantea 11061_1 CR5-6]|uniref:Amino acid permease/ SLC12A domain-containing protein n=1 Tax=Phlebiopsis gigantea (strain 11061_1 CR5-6) TaxID=745531 RepID=A0A0C3NEC6_PHLG1|nr:hypothetical protein PHLGIDRAFT_130425 [Phlebiopsis gigantea 11061_1 CR5-6]
MERRTPSFTTNNQAIPPGNSAATGRQGIYNLRSNSLRQRVHFREGTEGDHAKPLSSQRRRIQEFQKRWERIKTDLPPQLTRRHIGMISIGGVIGTGLFLGSGAALHNGGPVGALLGYMIIGTVVYCLCVSIGEMIAFLPNVGGVVGLADLYVDPAFGFSLGWAAWYNWSVTLPAELTAAVVVVKWTEWHNNLPNAALTVIFLLLATLINCFSSGVYGEFEYYFSAVKVLTIVCIIVLSLVIDLGAGQSHPVLFSHWKHPFASEYLGIDGGLGRFLGFWAVLMQASFSFFGSEVPGIAAGEVIDATRNVPRALQRVWIRITLFYVGGVFCAGLLVDRNDPALTNSANSGTVASSPFVIAFKNAGMHWMAHFVNAAVLLSAWSAAASDVYISSRFLFFLARCHHAPQIFASLFRYPSRPPQDPAAPSDASENDDVLDIPDLRIQVVEADNDEDSEPRDEEDKAQSGQEKPDEALGVSVEIRPASEGSSSVEDVSTAVPTPAEPTHEHEHETRTEGDVEGGPRERKPWFVLPLFAVLGSASMGLLAFLNSSGSGAEVAFNWLVAVASVASLQSWAGMLFTYIRWYQGTVYAEEKHKHNTHDGQDLTDHPQQEMIEDSRNVIAQIKRIRVHRHWGQPYLAYWAFGVCIVILFTNGWAVFLHTGWRIADIPDEKRPEYGSDQQVTDPVSIFLSSYIPIPVFILLTFGYKLIYQTKMVSVEEMVFSNMEVNKAAQQDAPYETTRRRILGWLLVE